jgi:hypothetical protein
VAEGGFVLHGGHIAKCAGVGGQSVLIVLDSGLPHVDMTVIVVAK